jgi:hypothetical protein
MICGVWFVHVIPLNLFLNVSSGLFGLVARCVMRKLDSRKHSDARRSDSELAHLYFLLILLLCTAVLDILLVPHPKWYVN